MEVTLTDKDYKSIAEAAHRLFTSKSTSARIKYNSLLCECFVEAFKGYVASKGWIVKDGKIWQNLIS